MSTQHFFLPDDCFQPNFVTFPEAVQNQISRVLRLHEGEEVIALDGRGMQYRLRLEQNTAGFFQGTILSKEENPAEPAVHLTLYISLTQREKFELILQKGSEVGVAAFQPFISSRSLIQCGDSFNKKRERWESILREAAEQCGRGCIPQLLSPLSLAEAVEAAARHALNLAAWEDETQAGLGSALAGFDGQGTLGLFVGPEGGFSELEARQMRAAGMRVFSLGRRILRMETAAVLAPALVLYQLGEMDRKPPA
jgi:16S rRNA (uracil1498-N3)-methyltransferase